MSWDIECTDQFETWWSELTQKEQIAMRQSIEALAAVGPSVGRPTADRIRQSRHHNMKELRRSSLRVLFAFDPRLSAILLLGGDKSERDTSSPTWNDWYRKFVPVADDLYDEYLAELKREGRIE